MAIVNEIILFIDHKHFCFMNQIMLFTDDKPSPAFFNAWYTNTEFSSIADLQSICELSGMSDIYYNIPTYPIADLAFPMSIWRPILACWPACCCCFYYQISVSELGAQQENCEESGLQEGTLQVLPVMVWSEEKLIFFNRINAG